MIDPALMSWTPMPVPLVVPPHVRAEIDQQSQRLQELYPGIALEVFFLPLVYHVQLPFVFMIIILEWKM